MNVDHIKLQEFARGFKFNETEDQITCLNEVLMIYHLPNQWID